MGFTLWLLVGVAAVIGGYVALIIISNKENRK